MRTHTKKKKYKTGIENQNKTQSHFLSEQNIAWNFSFSSLLTLFNREQKKKKGQIFGRAHCGRGRKEEHIRSERYIGRWSMTRYTHLPPRAVTVRRLFLLLRMCFGIGSSFSLSNMLWAGFIIIIHDNLGNMRALESRHRCAAMSTSSCCKASSPAAITSASCICVSYA